MKIKVRVPSTEKILFVKAKIKKAKKIKEILSIYNETDLKSPDLPLIKSVNFEKDKITLIIFKKYSKKELKSFILTVWRSH